MVLGTLLVLVVRHYLLDQKDLQDQPHRADRQDRMVQLVLVVLVDQMYQAVHLVQ